MTINTFLPKRPASWGHTFALLALLWGVSSLPAAAQVKDLGYTITPAASMIRFDDQAGIDNGPLYGAMLGFSFGEYIELSGQYLFNNDLRTDIGGLTALGQVPPDFDPALFERKLSLQRYGGALKVNVGRGRLFPFVTLGGGLLRFEPDNLDQSDTIYLTGGLGLQYSLADRYTFSVQVEDMLYRLNPSILFSEADLTDLGLTAGQFETENLSNLGITAGLQFYLGGRARGESTEVDRAFEDQFSNGLRGLSLKIEPFGGQIDFDRELGYQKNQRMAGVAAGFDFGPYVGLRGFYWRGVEDGEISQFDDLQAYGGELKLNFSSFGQNIAPYLTLGGGYMDVLDGYVGNGTVVPEDRSFVMAGGGLSLPLGNAVSLYGGVRSILMSTTDTREISNPNDVQTNWMYHAGISFGIGRQGRTGGSIIGEQFSETERQAQLQREQLAAEMAERERAMARAEARIDSLAQALLLARQGNTEALESMMAQRARQDSARTAPAKPAATPSSATEKANARPETPQDWVTFPVPREGELYVRYGKPGAVSVESMTGDTPTILMDTGTGLVPLAPGATGTPAAGAPTTGAAATPALSAAEIQAIVQQVLQAELARINMTPGQSGLNDAALLNQMEDRLNSRFETLERRLEDRVNRMEQQPTPVATPAGIPVTDTAATPSESNISFEAAMPLLGYNFDSPSQALFGFRADIRNPSWGAFRFYPEIILGTGDKNDNGRKRKTSLSINANVVRPLETSIFATVRPYVGAGLGFETVTQAELVFNLLVGAERTLGPGAVFGEYVSVDFFNRNRLLFGYRVNF